MKSDLSNSKIIWDQKVKRLCIERFANNTVSYKLCCKWNGGNHYVLLGKSPNMDLALARRKALKILRIIEILEGKFFLNDIHDIHGVHKFQLSEFLNKEYAPWVIVNRRTGHATLSRIKSCFFSQFDSCYLQDISPRSVEEWRTDRLKKGIKPPTINRDITALKSLLSKAVEWDLIADNPLESLKLLPVDNGSRVRYLTAGEESRLRRALTCCRVKYLIPMVLLSLNTGLRRGELLALRWSDVGFETKVLTVDGRHAKSGKTRYIPLNSEAISVLKSWESNFSMDEKHLIFSSPRNKNGKSFQSVRKSWVNLLKRAKIEDFRWHDMRHHFASRLVMNNVDLNTVRELLGHSDIKMTLRYSHLSAGHKAAAVATLDNFS